MIDLKPFDYFSPVSRLISVLTSWLDGKHVVFGKVLSGMSVVRKIEAVAVDRASKPLKSVYIKQSGSLPVKTPFPVDKSPSTL